MPQIAQGRVRFGSFELDPRAGELRHDGQSVILQEQQLKVLLMLIERAGEIATREEIKKKLWPNDTIVEFDFGINSTIKKLRGRLGDSADVPTYIQTIPRRGYRLMVPVEWVSADDSSAPDASDDSDALLTAKVKVGRLTGKVVSHYRVLEVIGGGGMGLVYRAEDLKLGRAVALKFLPEEVGDDPKARERFDREAHAVSALDHPNICTVYDFDEHEGHPFIAMQLLQGKTLRDHLADGRFRLSNPEGLEIAIQIACGLEAAHEKGIIHRDIKPANIFITDKNVAKILDFGVAKVMEVDAAAAAAGLDGMEDQSHAGLSPAQDHDEVDNSTPEGVLQSEPVGYTLTHTGMKLGTAGYMSPEQVRGEPLDTRTDIFSFGLVLYEMATGERAFTGETEVILHDEILHRDSKPVRELAPQTSPKLAVIIGRCLEKERESRYQTVVELRHSLEQARKKAATVEEVKPSRKRWKYAVAVTTVITILLGGFYSQRVRKAPKLTDKDTIVLADFENKTGDAVLDDALNTALTVELQQSPFLNLLAPDKVRATLKQMNRPETEKMTSETALEVCRRTQSAALVTGSVADVGNQYKLSLRATSCQTGKEWTRADASADSRNQIIHALGEAGYQLRSRLGEPKATLRDFNQPLDVATSASPEALEAFARGRNEQNAKGDSVALPYLRKAVDLDPQFALAHNRLGSAYWNLFERPLERPLAAESFKKAFELRDRATQHDRFEIEGKYYGLITGELEKSTGVYREWANAFPREYLPHANLGYVLRLRGEYQNAIDEAREAIRLNPNDYHPVYNLMLAEMAMERPEEAKAAYDEALSRNVDSVMLRWQRYSVAFVQRDEAAMQEQVTWSAGKPGARLLLDAESDTAEYYGRLAKAREFHRRAADLSKPDNNQYRDVAWVAGEARTEVEVGNVRRGGELLRPLADLNMDQPTEAAVALGLARANRVTEAEHLAGHLSQQLLIDTIVNPQSLSIRAAIKAAIELGKRNPAGAITALQPTARLEYASGGLYPAYLRGLAYLQLAEPHKAQTEFQKIIDHPGLVGAALIGALAHVQLARAQAMAGDKEAARKSYQDFLTLWKDADPEIPIYRQAKAEYAKLRAASN